MVHVTLTLILPPPPVTSILSSHMVGGGGVLCVCTALLLFFSAFYFIVFILTKAAVNLIKPTICIYNYNELLWFVFEVCRQMDSSQLYNSMYFDFYMCFSLVLIYVYVRTCMDIFVCMHTHIHITKDNQCSTCHSSNVCITQ